MTIVDDNPALHAEISASKPARSTGSRRSSGTRLAARLAWREVRRRKGRTALVVLLIAVPTMALVLASTIAHTEARTSVMYGQRVHADVVVNSVDTFTSLNDQTGTLPSGTTGVSYLKIGVPIEPATPLDTPFLDQLYVGLTNMPMNDLNTIGIIEVTSGTAPRPGELLLSDDIADQLGVDVGDELTLVRPSGTWTVSGMALPSSTCSANRSAG